MCFHYTDRETEPPLTALSLGFSYHIVSENKSVKMGLVLFLKNINLVLQHSILDARSIGKDLTLIKHTNFGTKFFISRLLCH